MPMFLAVSTNIYTQLKLKRLDQRRVSLTRPNGFATPLLTLSMTQDHVRPAGSKTKVFLNDTSPFASLNTNGSESPSGFAWPVPPEANAPLAVLSSHKRAHARGR